MELKLSNRAVEGVTVVDCSGRIVFGEESAYLRDTVKALLSETKRIVLNLRGVSYIDSGGLGTLVSLYTSAQTAGGEIKLAELTQRTSQLLQVTKLVTVFDVKSTEQEAIAAFPKVAKA